jgi:hypothetical protein
MVRARFLQRQGAPVHEGDSEEKENRGSTLLRLCPPNVNCFLTSCSLAIDSDALSGKEAPTPEKGRKGRAS